ncbi:MAG TPA: oxygen-independent coproporphyrinogen III oxidase, partial [Vicinamibacterales bacterium]|nr:oxygen-independent coproporphyrinogen III oxidase [Vicinamibacterales bacterium]
MNERLSALLAKYDVAVPRYTSYPAVPHWRDVPDAATWFGALDAALSGGSSSLAVYVHLPFCETLCTFCGCNTVITRNHDRSAPYVDVVLAELDLYLAHVARLRQRPVSQLHLGGGTPTFLPPAALQQLLGGLSSRMPHRAAEYEGSVEVDPRVTTGDHLDAMRAHGLTRISLGVQDFDTEVLRLVNRPQPFELTERLCAMARGAGYESINFDLIYGLPGQTPDKMARLADQVIACRPDRLAVYSFARVPWIKPAQRKFKDEDVPVADAKRALYEVLRDHLLAAGYEEIGMDHFALPQDSLARAARAGTLHRNFMGYTDGRTTALLGLGVSAISETPACYHQNEKVITVYERRVANGEIPTHRGHVLSDDDQRRAGLIRSL